MDYSERIQHLESRCTPFAMEVLTGLKQHSRFQELASRLERIDGLIFELDVEHALREVMAKAEEFTGPDAIRLTASAAGASTPELRLIGERARQFLPRYKQDPHWRLAAFASGHARYSRSRQVAIRTPVNLLSIGG